MTVPSMMSPPVACAARDPRSGRRGPTLVSRCMPRGVAAVEVLESGPSVAGRLTALASRMTVRPVLAVGSRAATLPWPWGVVDHAARLLMPTTAALRATVALPQASAQLIRARGVLPADGTRRVVLYLHGGAFLACGANSHGRLVEALSSFADAPVLVVNYRLLPKHSIGMALQDCLDGYRWLRTRGYRPEQIALVGDSAGGYLAMALAQRLLEMSGALGIEGDRSGPNHVEQPAALVAISPLLQLAAERKRRHPNSGTDAMFPPGAFTALSRLVDTSAARNRRDGVPEPIYEPLDHISAGMPRTLIHVSGSEVLLHDAQLAAARLAACGVPVELRIWPGQIHDFQIAAPLVPEATRSLRQIGGYIRDATG